MHKVFISYYHDSDQCYKEELVRFGEENEIFIDASVDTGDISDDLTDEQIRGKIRDEYLRDSTVTVVLVGTETKNRKHVDWEIYSSMHDGVVNKKSGVLVINLPEAYGPGVCTVSHEGEKETVYPDITSWKSVKTKVEYERRHPYLPDRIVDNLLKPEAKVSVAPWDRVKKQCEELKIPGQRNL